MNQSVILKQTAEESSSGAHTNQALEGQKLSSEVATVDPITLKNLPAYQIEQWILSQPQTQLPVEHSHCNGLYARTLFIPAGCILSGAVHKEESFFLIRSGQLRVTTDDGVITVLPGFMNVTKPGTKRIGFALTDVLCTTFHANPTNEQEPEALWGMLSIPPPENLAQILELFQNGQIDAMGRLKIEEAQE